MQWYSNLNGFSSIFLPHWAAINTLHTGFFSWISWDPLLKAAWPVVTQVQPTAAHVTQTSNIASASESPMRPQPCPQWPSSLCWLCYLKPWGFTLLKRQGPKQTAARPHRAHGYSLWTQFGRISEPQFPDYKNGDWSPPIAKSQMRSCTCANCNVWVAIK